MSGYRDVREVFICPIGLSPGPVTTFISKMIRRGVRPSYVVIIGTSDTKSVVAAAIAKTYLVNRLGLGKGAILSIHTEASDIADEEDLKRYLERLRSLVKMFRGDTRGRIHLLFTPGRKISSLIIFIFSMLIRPVHLYHVHTIGIDEVKVDNNLIRELEIDEGDIESGIMRRIWERWDIVMSRFRDSLDPSDDMVRLLEITPIPYPRSYIDYVLRIAEEREPIERREEYLGALIGAGMVAVDGDRYRPTERLGFWRSILQEISS